jgi:DNA-binding NtrC family response regulator
VDLLDRRVASALATLLDGAVQPGLLAATAPTGWTDDGPRPLVDRLPIRLRVPSLAERHGDVAPLLDALSGRHGAPSLRWLAPAVRHLEARPLPGNVRELESVVRAVVATQRVGDVGVDRLPAEYRQRLPSGLSRLARLERAAIEAALAEAAGNRHRAATALGISRATLYRKLDIYQLHG